MQNKGKLNLVSVGPGFMDLVPPLAEIALRESNIVVGYKLYFTWIQSLIEGKEIHSFSLTQERERAQKAIACARSGNIVSLVSSGDIGIYGMAPLVLEEMTEDEEFQLQVIPGVSAANSSAALLGSPLSHDFATLSLSDLLCPWEWIKNRARHLARADLVVALYNVQSQSRPDGIYRILRILSEEKAASTWCGVVRNAFRPDQSAYLCSLAELQERQFDMLTTIIVGNRFTQRKGQFIYTPRGYNGWPLNARERTGTQWNAGNVATGDLLTANGQAQTANRQPVWVFSGTRDGNALAAELLGRGYRVIVSTASDYGGETASIVLPGVEIRSGRLGVAARRSQLRASGAMAIVDATHPFAVGISEQLIELAAELSISYIRYERPAAVMPSFARQAADIAAAARLATEIGQRIFLATGIKDLDKFLTQQGAEQREWFLRITPDTGSLEIALQAGISRSHICAMQGPFSTEFNTALWSAWKVDCVVTKESGETGGFSFKAEAAAKLGISFIVVKRPQLSYPAVTSDFNSVAELLEQSLPQRKNSRKVAKPQRESEASEDCSPESIL
ncbi:MAG: precorrin-3B C(17)-methyltransferase [Verrucomicrobia bacterium]|nr:precorrin-3B C(17)-methyltransferase [Verrucomicrobiota bacterium]